MENTSPPKDSRPARKGSFADNQLFMATLDDFASICAMTAPPKNTFGWIVWKITRDRAQAALIAVIDYSYTKYLMAAFLFMKNYEDAKAAQEQETGS